MEALDGSSWDVIIAGTGLHESLLALALSRSNKNIIHVDKNNYYSGTEAALSLDEAEQWAAAVAASQSSVFSHASTSKSPSEDGGERVGPSRAYSLGLAQQVLHARSMLLPGLVSSRVDNQLEFLAMGHWFTFAPSNHASGQLSRVPNGREDLFASQDISPASKRSLIKLLRLVADPEAAIAASEEHGHLPFHDFLQSQYNIAPAVQPPIHALAMSPKPPRDTTTAFALPRIARHLASLGMLGPGFGAVIPKWGGMSEVAQIGCRANAVGGAVYVLGNGIDSVETIANGEQRQPAAGTQAAAKLRVKLAQGDSIESTWLVGSLEQLPAAVRDDLPKLDGPEPLLDVSRKIAIVSSPLPALFPPPAEGAPPPAGAVVMFAADALLGGQPAAAGDDGNANAPVFVTVHTSDTGECPKGQCVLYASIGEPLSSGSAKLDRAIALLLNAAQPPAAAADPSGKTAAVLWSLQYQQRGSLEGPDSPAQARDNLIAFPALETDVIFNDIALARVREAWRLITGLDPMDGGFLNFPPRQEEDETDEPMQL